MERVFKVRHDYAKELTGKIIRVEVFGNTSLMKIQRVENAKVGICQYRLIGEEEYTIDSFSLNDLIEKGECDYFDLKCKLMDKS